MADEEDNLAYPLEGNEEEENAETTPMTARGKKRKEKRTPPFGTSLKRILRSALAELIGTFVLVFITIAATYVGLALENRKLSVALLLYIALAHGMAYASIVYALSFDGSGGRPNIRQLNPGVSLALVLMLRIKVLDCIVFILSQYAGAWIAIAVTPYALPPNPALANLHLEKGLTLTHEILASIFVSFVFILIILLTFFDKSRVSIRQDDQALDEVPVEFKEQKPQTQHEINCLIALAIALACTAVVTPFSLDYMNPVLAMGFSYLRGSWPVSTNVGPFVGAIVAMLVGRLCDWQLDWIKSLYGGRTAGSGTALGNRRRPARRGENANANAAAAADGQVQLSEPEGV